MSEREYDWQGPTNGKKAVTFADYYSIATHPAFRLGFLDAQTGRPFDHDAIVERIRSETPPNALRRIGWDAELFSRNEIELAQYRYEEGRFAVVEYGLKCRAWGHPDFPPRAVVSFIEWRVKALSPTPITKPRDESLGNSEPDKPPAIPADNRGESE